jgi:hypothetical protein
MGLSTAETDYKRFRWIMSTCFASRFWVAFSGFYFYFFLVYCRKIGVKLILTVGDGSNEVLVES